MSHGCSACRIYNTMPEGRGRGKCAVGGGGEVLVAREGEDVVHAAMEGGGKVLIVREGEMLSAVRQGAVLLGQ